MSFPGEAVGCAQAVRERDRYKKERDDLLLGLAEKIDQGVLHRYKRERDDLLQALFLPLKSRQAMADRILGADNSLKITSPGPLRKGDGSPGEALGEEMGR